MSKRVHAGAIVRCVGHFIERTMARTTRLKRLFPIALNVDAAAAALSCSLPRKCPHVELSSLGIQTHKRNGFRGIGF